MRTTRPLTPLAALMAFLLLAACDPDAPEGQDERLTEEARAALSQMEGDVPLDGLQEPVEVLRDDWGVPHIYAENLDDLFFAQGFVQAQDRLWQMEIWRRVVEGRLSELLGSQAVEHDRLMRLFQYQGPWDDEEWQSYHPEGERIAEAFAAGINAYIEKRDDDLPLEFQLTGIEPGEWQPETSFLRARVGAWVGQARRQLNLAMDVAEYGVEDANERNDPNPWRELEVPEGLDVSVITEAAVESLSGNRYGQYLQPTWRDELIPDLESVLQEVTADLGTPELSPGSNNWAISGELTASGSPILAADPHRQVTNPALRYLVHLNAPGWNSFGITEPQHPGVYVGHSGDLAWGRTSAGNQIGDVFVEELDPDDPMRTRYQGDWSEMEVREDTIEVRDGQDEVVELLYSRHGPVFHVDEEENRAYALKTPMQMRGSAEFVGALHLNQGETVDDCLHPTDVPLVHATSLVCADADGGIAFRNAAMHPVRDGWDGRLPVPGTGEYGWDGWRDDLPREENPDRGWVATANHDLQAQYEPEPPIYFANRGRYRYERIEEVLSDGEDFTVEDSRDLQLDALSVEAREALDHFQGWEAEDGDAEWARAALADWDAVMDRESTAAALWWEWRSAADHDALEVAAGEDRPALVEEALQEAVASLEEKLGSDRDEWRWGRLHRSTFPHTLLPQFDLPDVERSGGANTVAATGAVFRQVVDFSDLDASIGTLTPGQSAQPESPFYDNLLPLWEDGDYIPFLWTREAVEEHTRYELHLQPR